MMRRWLERRVIDEMAKVEEDLGEACLFGRVFAETLASLPADSGLSVAQSNGDRGAVATAYRPSGGHAQMVATARGETPTLALYELAIKLRSVRS